MAHQMKVFTCPLGAYSVTVLCMPFPSSGTARSCRCVYVHASTGHAHRWRCRGGFLVVSATDVGMVWRCVCQSLRAWLVPWAVWFTLAAVTCVSTGSLAGGCDCQWAANLA